MKLTLCQVTYSNTLSPEMKQIICDHAFRLDIEKEHTHTHFFFATIYFPNIKNFKNRQSHGDYND